MSNPQSRPLDVVQRWFAEVMTHPTGVEEGIEAAEAQELIHLRRDQIEQVIRRSKRLTATERLGVYANAYYARLLDCLRESFPVLARTAGREVFDGFAVQYLQAYPSRSYTLNRLGEAFADFLDLTRPDRNPGGSQPAVNWPDFLIDLARLEWEIEQVFDGPGVEGKPLLDSAAISALAPAQGSHAKLVVVPCLRLLSFRYAVNEYYTQARKSTDDVALEMPEPAPQFLALNRRAFIVKRHLLSRPQFELLSALSAGKTLLESVQTAADFIDAGDDAFAKLLRDWFAQWTAAGFFSAIAP